MQTIPQDTSDEYVPENFLDLYLFRVARQQNKQIYGLEPYRNQFDRAGKKGTWSKEEELFMHLYLNELINLYVKGDINQIEKQLAYEMPDSVHFIKRNYDMLNSIITRAHENGIFAAMGTAHLYGKNGLIALLRDKGYQLRRMDRGGITPPIKFENEFDKSRWLKFTDPANRFTIDLPGEFCSSTTIDGVNFNLHIDPLSNQTFIIGSGLPDLNVDERTMYSTILKNIGGKGIDTRKLTPVRIKTEDGQAVQIKLIVDDYDLEYRYFFQEGFLFYFFHGHKVGDANAEIRATFFNSLEFHTNEKNSAVTMEKRGAFQVAFPGTPLSQSINLTGVDYGPFQKLHQWVFADPEEKTQYLLQYTDINSDENFLGEKNVIQNMISGLVDYSIEPLQHDTSRIQGYPVQRDVYQLEDKSYMGTLMTIRGNRLYLLLKSAIAKITIDDPFFTSFSFLPFEKTEDKLVYGNDKEFSILAHSSLTPVVDSSYFQFSHTQHMWTYFKSQNDFNSSLLSVEKVALSPYLEYTWSDSLIKVFNGYYAFSEDGFTEQRDSMSGYPSQRLTGISDGAVKTVEYFITGKTLYAVNVTEPHELDGLKNATAFINSFRLLNPPAADAKRGAELLLTDLMSTDSLKREKATFAIEDARFLPGDIPLIETYLTRKWNDDTLNTGVRYKLLDRYKELGSSGTINVLSSIADQVGSRDAYVTSLLRALVHLGTPVAHAIADSLLNNNLENEKIYGYYLLKDYYDSVELFQAHLPFFIKHFDHPRIGNQLQYLTLDHIHDNSFDLSPYTEQLGSLMVSSFKRDVGEYLKKRSKEDLYYGSGPISSQMQLLSHLGKFREVQPYIADILAKNDNSLTAICLILLMRHDQKYDQKLLTSLLNNKHEAHAFVFKAFNRKVLDKIPEGLYNEMKIAESDVFSYASEDYYPDKVVFREKRFVPGSTDQYFYVFEVLFEDDPDRFLGVSGPYPLSKASDYSNDGTDFSFEPVTATNYEKLVEKLMEKKDPYD